MKTRIKICGLTRDEDVEAAVAAGADALGFVFYPAQSALRDAAAGCGTGQTDTTVHRCCRPVRQRVAGSRPRRLRSLPINVLQFHGDENAAYCRQFSSALSAGSTGEAGARSGRIRQLNFPMPGVCCWMPLSRATAAVAMSSTGR